METDKKTYILINSLKRGGAERILAAFDTKLEYEKLLMLETDVEYKVNKPQDFLSEHNFHTSSLIKLLYIPIYAWRLSRIAKKGDVVLSSLERSNIVNIVSKIFFRHKAVIWIHISLSDEYSGKKRLIGWFLKAMYSFADKVVSVSNGVARDIESNFGIDSEKSSVIYNPIPAEAMKQWELDKDFEKIFRNPVLLTAGRLHPQKGQWHLLKLMKELLPDHPKLKLCIMGEGGLLEDLISYSSALGLKVWKRGDVLPGENCSVFFMGLQQNPFQFEEKATWFVFPSHREGFPMVLGEAMACGLPIISSDCPSGPRELLSPNHAIESGLPEFADYGILMPIIKTPLKPFDLGPLSAEEKVWLEVLKKSLSEPEMRKKYSEKGRVRAKDLELSVLADSWNSLFASLKK